MATQRQPYDCIDFCREQYVLESAAKVSIRMSPGISELALLPEGFLRRKEAEQVSALGSPRPFQNKDIKPSMV